MNSYTSIFGNMFFLFVVLFCNIFMRESIWRVVFVCFCMLRLLCKGRYLSVFARIYLFEHTFISIYIAYFITNFSWRHRVIIKKSLLVYMILDVQYTEYTHFMIIAHVANTKQNVIHMGNVESPHAGILFHSTFGRTHFTNAVHKGSWKWADIIFLSQCEHWCDSFLFISNIFVTIYHYVD